MRQALRSRLVVLATGLVTVGLASTAAAAVSDTEGQSTVQQRVVPAAPGAYRFLQLGAGEPYTVRQDLGTAVAGREETRTSLVYFGQLSDFQLADEESPARVEVVDPLATPTFPSARPGAPGRRSSRRSTRRRSARSTNSRRPAPSQTAVKRTVPWTSRSTPATPPTASSSTRPSGSAPCSRAARLTRTAASTKRATRIPSARTCWCRAAPRPPATPGSRTTTTTSRAPSPSSTTPTAPPARTPPGPNTRV